MNADCDALSIPCNGDQLVAILHHGAGTRGVLLVVGGPQYRVGSHRQFVHVARTLASAGYPVLRFDYRGMGDSTGEQRDFEQVDDDLRAALDTFFVRCPSLRDVVIWGLCDAASAALMYAFRDSRVSGVIAVNPWLRSEQGLAQTYLRHYYLRRLVSGSFWRKLLSGRLGAGAALHSLWINLRRAIRWPRASGASANEGAASLAPYPRRMQDGLAAFSGRLLLLLCGDDLTAREFSDVTAADPGWKKLLSDASVTCHRLPRANHTFSRREWRDRLMAWTLDWLRAW